MPLLSFDSIRSIASALNAIFTLAGFVLSTLMSGFVFAIASKSAIVFGERRLASKTTLLLPEVLSKSHSTIGAAGSSPNLNIPTGSFVTIELV